MFLFQKICQKHLNILITKTAFINGKYAVSDKVNQKDLENVVFSLKKKTSLVYGEEKWKANKG